MKWKEFFQEPVPVWNVTGGGAGALRGGGGNNGGGGGGKKWRLE